MNVNKKNFYPIPKVDSVVLEFDPLKEKQNSQKRDATAGKKLQTFLIQEEKK